MERREVVWLGARCHLQQLAVVYLNLSVGSDAIRPSPLLYVTWLGVFIHAEFTFRERVRRVVRSCFFFQLRRIRQIRKHVNRHVMKPLVHAFVVNSSNGSKVCGTPGNFNEFRNLAKLVVCRDRCSLRYRVGATSSEGSLAIDVSLPTSTNGSTGYTVHNQVNLTLTVS